jgi:two-component system, NarL family, response regulator LiaR
VVDDHHLFRQGLKAVLEAEGFDVVGEAVSGEHAVEVAAAVEPNVVIMDLHMPGISGVEATRRIRERLPSTRVLVLTVSAADADVVSALLAGGSGYLLKDTAPAQIAAGVRATAAGDAMLSPAATARLLGRVQPAAQELPDPPELSERELQVLKLITEGLDNGEIAERLVISPTTVKKHVSNVLTKMGVESRVQAAIHAVRRGVV